MFRHLSVFSKCLLKIPAYMSHAVNKAHVRVGLESRFVTLKAVTLEITLEVFSQLPYHRT